MLDATNSTALKSNKHLTFRANVGVGRHGWLRLTPAYGVQIVRERLENVPTGSVITDPFSGPGTTPLAAAELGHIGQSVDINPFLVWLGAAKVSYYSSTTLRATADAARAVLSSAVKTNDMEL